MLPFNRTALLSAIAALLAVALLWRWVGGWGLVSVNFVEAPVAKVLAAVQKQSGLRLLTNAAADTLVTLQVQRAPVFEALDLLAARLDADLRLVYCLAPSQAAAQAGLQALTSPPSPESWRVIGGGWGGRMFSVGDTALDLRKMTISPSPQEELSLRAFLEQLAQKSGIYFVIPADWNPQLPKLPERASAERMASIVAKSVRGQALQAVLLSTRLPAEQRAQRRESDPGAASPWASARSGTERSSAREPTMPPNPEWMAERLAAQIALLPTEEQTQARQDVELFRSFWDEVRVLPEDQRRAKFQEFLAKPEVQARWEERMAVREMKRTPEQRTQRYKRYLERKRQALATP